ncbi:MAG: hypothetical protein H7Z43_11630 [Clostridia bacterium]|nr:hypothetical protein [Deltaproteobacteria bacterium]
MMRKLNALPEHEAIRLAALERIATLDAISESVCLIIRDEIQRCNSGFASLFGVARYHVNGTPLRVVLQGVADEQNVVARCDSVGPLDEVVRRLLRVRALVTSRAGVIVDAFESNRSGGTGLGLYLCRRLLELMGGSIVCASSNEGTTVRVSLKAANQPKFRHEDVTRL